MKLGVEDDENDRCTRCSLLWAPLCTSSAEFVLASWGNYFENQNQQWQPSEKSHFGVFKEMF